MDDHERGSLEHLLAVARSEGRVDSTGVFTIDLWAAREKFRAYLLPNPRLYILRLLRAAVLSGAPWLDVELSHKECRVIIPGLVIEPEALGGLLDQLLKRNDPAVWELAVAVNTLMTLELEMPPRPSVAGSSGGATPIWHPFSE